MARRAGALLTPIHWAGSASRLVLADRRIRIHRRASRTLASPPRGGVHRRASTEPNGSSRSEGAPGLHVQAGDRRIEVIRRTGSVALRVHHPKSPHLQDHHGIPAYAPTERRQAPGNFTPYPQPTTVTTGAVVEGFMHHPPRLASSTSNSAGAPLDDSLPSPARRAHCTCCSPTPPAV